MRSGFGQIRCLGRLLRQSSRLLQAFIYLQMIITMLLQILQHVSHHQDHCVQSLHGVGRSAAAPFCLLRLKTTSLFKVASTRPASTCLRWLFLCMMTRHALCIHDAAWVRNALEQIRSTAPCSRQDCLCHDTCLGYQRLMPCFRGKSSALICSADVAGTESISGG